MTCARVTRVARAAAVSINFTACLRRGRAATPTCVRGHVCSALEALPHAASVPFRQLLEVAPRHDVSRWASHPEACAKYPGSGMLEWAAEPAAGVAGIFGRKDVAREIGAAEEFLSSERYTYLKCSTGADLPAFLVAYLLAARRLQRAAS